jgi:hypothetical protein
MAKSNLGLIAVIITLVIVGAAAGAYYFYFLKEDTKTTDPPPPPPTNQAPVAFFEPLNGSEGRVGELMFFDANNSYDPDPEDSIVTFDWNWGDGSQNTKSNGTNTTGIHSFSIPGEFTVNLTVWDDRGARGSYTDTVIIRPTDYTASSVEILMSREVSGVSIDTMNLTIPVDPFAISMEISLTIIGAAIGDQAIEDAVLNVEIYNPHFDLIANQTNETKWQSIVMRFYFDSDDLQITGDYEMVATCEQGSLYLSYTVEVLY